MRMCSQVAPGSLFDDPGEGSCPGYQACRTHENKKDARAALEDAFHRHSHVLPEAPDHFVRQFRQDFDGRAWELFLVAALAEAGLDLERPPAKGPDVCVRLPSGRRCWIEAVAATPGTGRDCLPPSLPGRGPGYTEEALILRYTSAINDKLAKISRYETEGIIAPGDTVLVALSPGTIPYADLLDVEVPVPVKAVLPIGRAFLRVVPYSSEPPTGGIERREDVFKKNQSKVGTTLFLSERSAPLSGLLFAGGDIYLWTVGGIRPDSARRALSLLRNPSARPDRLLPNGTLPLPEEQFWVDEAGVLRHRGARVWGGALGVQGEGGGGR